MRATVRVGDDDQVARGGAIELRAGPGVDVDGAAAEVDLHTRVRERTNHDVASGRCESLFGGDERRHQESGNDSGNDRHSMHGNWPPGYACLNFWMRPGAAASHPAAMVGSNSLRWVRMMCLRASIPTPLTGPSAQWLGSGAGQ